MNWLMDAFQSIDPAWGWVIVAVVISIVVMMLAPTDDYDDDDIFNPRNW